MISAPVIGVGILLLLCLVVGLGWLLSRRAFGRFTSRNELTPAGDPWQLSTLTLANPRETPLAGSRVTHVGELAQVHVGHRLGHEVLAAKEMLGRGEQRNDYYVLAARCPTGRPWSYAGDDYLAVGDFPEPARGLLRALVDGRYATAVFTDGDRLVVRARELGTLQPCLEALGDAVDAAVSRR